MIPPYSTEAAPTTPPRFMTRRTSVTTLVGSFSVSSMEWHRTASKTPERKGSCRPSAAAKARLPQPIVAASPRAATSTSVNIDTQDPAVRHHLGDAHGDRCLTAAEIEHDHVRSQLREKVVCVDSCAASRKRRLDLPFFPDLVQTKALRDGQRSDQALAPGAGVIGGSAEVLPAHSQGARRERRGFSA